MRPTNYYDSFKGSNVNSRLKSVNSYYTEKLAEKVRTDSDYREYLSLDPSIEIECLKRYTRKTMKHI